MIEHFFTAESSDGMFCYQMKRETTDDSITIIVYCAWGENLKEKRRISYKNIGKEYLHPFLNWHNVLFCSGDRELWQDYEYLNTAVQQGTKTAATIYLEPDSVLGKEIMKSLPENVSALPFEETMIYIFHKGCLADFFDFAQIKTLYENHGVARIDWKQVEFYFQKDLSSFADIKACGFSLQSGGNREQLIITGLVLGYPIESTVAMLK